MNPQDLIRSARRQASGDGRGRPRQTDLCRAVSSAYYAMFHTLARCGADLLAGATRSAQRQPAWAQTYRALEHGHALNQCRNRAVVDRFPPAIQEFAGHFVETQRNRHRADYAPLTSFSRSWVGMLIDQTERIIGQFNATPAADRRAFAIYVLFRLRPD